VLCAIHQENGMAEEIKKGKWKMDTKEVKRIPVVEPNETQDADQDEKDVAPADDLDAVLTEASNPELDAEQAAKDAAAVAESLSNDNEEAVVYRKNGWTPMQAIKNKCMDCCNFQRKELYLCQVKGCPLWPFRKGRKPVKRQVSEEFRVAASARFKKMHADKKEAFQCLVQAFNVLEEQKNFDVAKGK